MRTAPKIVTTHVFPSIPIRSFDWSAHYDGEEGDFMAIGWGSTEEDAIEDLKEQFPRGDNEIEQDVRIDC